MIWVWWFSFLIPGVSEIISSVCLVRRLAFDGWCALGVGAQGEGCTSSGCIHYTLGAGGRLNGVQRAWVVGVYFPLFLVHYLCLMM